MAPKQPSQSTTIVSNCTLNFACRACGVKAFTASTSDPSTSLTCSNTVVHLLPFLLRDLRIRATPSTPLTSRVLVQLLARRLVAVTDHNDASASRLTTVPMLATWCEMAHDEVPYRAPSSSTPVDFGDTNDLIRRCSTASLLMSTGFPCSSRKRCVLSFPLRRSNEIHSSVAADAAATANIVNVTTNTQIMRNHFVSYDRMLIVC
eukprot:1906743-Prymnesium_polylepis.1